MTLTGLPSVLIIIIILLKTGPFAIFILMEHADYHKPPRILADKQFLSQWPKE